MIPSCETAALFHKGVHRRDVSLFNADCLDVLKDLASHTVDALVTSPPYDNLRTYNGYEFDFEAIAAELYRVTKPGGVVVWVVNDATVKGSETGTSFKQALHFMSLGFNLHDTMIWRKTNPPPQTKEGRRYTLSSEYMFVLTKGKINTFNPIHIPTLNAGKKIGSGSQRKPDGSHRDDRKAARQGTSCNETKQLTNVWDLPCSRSSDHPATFPIQLAKDHILSWSNPGDVVLDPFLGSGTTGVAALELGRRFIGIEISQEYFDIASARLTNKRKS